MLIIGITGGIGSGKTAASDYLAAQGITVVDADQVSRQIVEPGEPALEQIRARFGDRVLGGDGRLDRAALREIVFADPDERAALEAITHPAIGAEIRRQLEASESSYTILVSPLLLETDQYQMVERVLLVDVPESVQVERTARRDEVPGDQIRHIMAAQMDRQERRRKADDIVLNDGSLADLHEQLDHLHQYYLELARNHGG
jgi:dephospho-CoA kinase